MQFFQLQKPLKTDIFELRKLVIKLLQLKQPKPLTIRRALLSTYVGRLEEEGRSNGEEGFRLKGKDK